MENNEDRILVFAPVSSRAWILPYYLECLLNLDFPRNKLSFYFLINNSKDNSIDILQDFKKQHDHEYNSIDIDTFPTPKNMPQDERTDAVRKKYTYTHLSNLRNQGLSYAAKRDFTHVFSVDSDILVKPDTLSKLLSHNKPVVSGLIYNGHQYFAHKPYLYPNILKLTPYGTFEHISNYYVKNADTLAESKLIEVDANGAISLISREVFTQCKYGYHDQGEDMYFCLDCARKGFKLYCDIAAFAYHIMSPQMLEEYIRKRTK